MDAFFASIEQRDYPEYKGLPLVVGYQGDRGVIAAASYEARKFGVRSAMSSKLALKKCPDLIFVPTRFEVYKSVSSEIREIFLEYTDLVEPLSLDEAFLDVTVNHKNMEFAIDIAKEIKEKIYKKTNLTASAGISFNKFLAKMASDINKPNGLYVITPKKSESFVERMKVEDFFGVGRKTAERMNRLGIMTGLDLKKKTEQELVNLFGKSGKIYYLHARGLDHSEVNPNRIRKSIGTENTFSEDTDSLPTLYDELSILAQDLIKSIIAKSFKGKTLTLKIKFADFKVISRSKTLNTYISEYSTLYQTALELFYNVELVNKVRLLGLSIKNSELEKIKSKQSIQLELPFPEY